MRAVGGWVVGLRVERVGVVGEDWDDIDPASQGRRGFQNLEVGVTKVYEGEFFSGGTVKCFMCTRGGCVVAQQFSYRVN